MATSIYIILHTTAYIIKNIRFPVDARCTQINYINFDVIIIEVLYGEYIGRGGIHKFV